MITPAPQIRIAGVTFRKVGKLHYYDVDSWPDLTVGSHVVAQTERGTEYGEVKLLRVVQSDDAPPPFRLLRCATSADENEARLRDEQTKDGLVLCQQTADELGLPLRIVDAEGSFDGQQITFYFVAEARIDFRQLVKEVAARLRTRVLLHQVGSRDHAKALGGYGPCGRPLCCTTFLRDFAPVSMKMAKDQSLYLNPSKFSGVCGKLMCCLRYEHDTYLEARDRLPSVGMTVTLPSGDKGPIIAVNIFRETATVLVRTEEDTREVTVPAAEVRAARACGDCGSAGGGCGSSCGSGKDGGCAPTKQAFTPIALEVRRKTDLTANNR